MLMTLHGIAHLVGFVGSWWPAALRDYVYKTTVIGGLVDIGDGGIRLVGLAWLAAAIAFITVASLALANRPVWIPLAPLGVSVTSLLLCIIGWPAARIGLGVNAALLVAILVGQRAGKLLTCCRRRWEPSR
jgi:hypothetical protein